MPTSTSRTQKAVESATGNLFDSTLVEAEAPTPKPKRARKPATARAKRAQAEPSATTEIAAPEVAEASTAMPTTATPKAATPNATTPIQAPEVVQGMEIPAIPGVEIAPASLINGIIKAEDYLVQTSQEVDALMRAACDGRTGTLWENDEQASTRSHAVPGAPHHIQLALSDGERAQGVPLQVLEDLTFAQDPDFNFALLYVSRVLAPPAPLPARNLASEWVDLDDVMNKIGLDPRSTKERIELRNRVWRYLLFGARASIIGQRKGNYVDKRTGKRIETVIDEPAWLVMSKEKPAQPQLFPDIGEAPLRVRLVASEAWTRLTTLPETAQYLPMGELLGAIPGNKPSGAWARVLGLALSSFWRRQPRAAIGGLLKPTRRELLERYTPRTATPSEVLGSKDPRRAIEYWQGALQILVDCGFLEREGEAKFTYQQLRDALPRQDWQQLWFNQTVDLRPGPQMREAVQACADALPVLKPRELGAPKKRKKMPKKEQPKEAEVSAQTAEEDASNGA